MEKGRPISDAELEQHLEAMFGMPDGTDSEDALEDSDNDEYLENILEPEFADSLLTSSVTRRRGKHGKEQATSEWEEHEELKDITDCESDIEIENENMNIAPMSVSVTPHATSAIATPALPGSTTIGIGSEPRQITPNEIAIDSPVIQPIAEDSSRSSTRTSSQTTCTRLTHASTSRAITLPSASANNNGQCFDSDGTDSDEDETEWKKTDWTNTPDVSSFDEHPLRPRNNFSSRSAPLAYFEVFFDAEVISNLVNQTNLFATQNNARNFVPVTEIEIKAYIGMLIQMGIHKLPCIEDYWSSDPALCVPEVAETMTLQRFQKISNYLHINDNEQMPRRGDANFDKLYKIRPLLDQINQKCQNNANNTKSQSIDESMVKFKGRSALKQYLPMKPIKRGYKIWARADSATGYLFQFQVYTGKGENIETGLGSTVVKTLSHSLIDEGCAAHLSFDNFFCSYELLQYLYDNGIHSTATSRNDRVGLPVLVKKPTVPNADEIMKRQNEKLKKLKRGEYKWRTRNNVGFIRWKDTKLVTVMSTAFHPKETTSCLRTQKDGTKKSFTCPVAVSEYTKRMGGVDRFDQKKAVYELGRKSKKWWKRLFYFLLDVAITNSHILYANNSRVHNPMSQKAFRLALARGLINNTTFRKRKFSSMPKYAKKSRKSEDDSRQKKVFSIPEEIQYGNIGQHFPEAIPTYRRCRLCSSATKNKRSNVQCDTCEVPLCVVPCFKEFHHRNNQ